MKRSALTLRAWSGLPRGELDDACCTNSKKWFVSVANSMTFSRRSLTQSQATNLTAHTPYSDHQRSVIPLRLRCTVSMNACFWAGEADIVRGDRHAIE
jgi:hypothetical protein